MYIILVIFRIWTLIFKLEGNNFIVVTRLTNLNLVYKYLIKFLW